MRVWGVLFAVLVAAGACGDDDDLGGFGAGGDVQGGDGGSGGSGGTGGDAPGGSGGEDPCGFELGTGRDAFEPLAPNQEVPIILGGQGGFHVWNALRLRGYTGIDYRVQLSVTIDDTEVGGWSFCLQAPEAGEDGVVEIPKLFNLITGTRAEVENYVGQTAVLRARAWSDADLLDCQIPASPTCDRAGQVSVTLGEIVPDDAQPGG